MRSLSNDELNEISGGIGWVIPAIAGVGFGLGFTGSMVFNHYVNGGA